MAYGIPDQKELTVALREFLEIYSEHPVGDHQAPFDRVDALKQTSAPYSIMHALPGGMSSGPPLGYADSDFNFEYQITVVGLRPDQTLMLLQKIREVMIGRDLNYALKYPLIVPGLVVMDRTLASPPGGVLPIGKIFNAIESYFVKVSVEV